MSSPARTHVAADAALVVSFPAGEAAVVLAVSSSTRASSRASSKRASVNEWIIFSAHNHKQLKITTRAHVCTGGGGGGGSNFLAVIPTPRSSATAAAANTLT